MFRPLRRIEKTWGHELWIHNSPMYCGKILVVMPGRRLSYHYHKNKCESFIVIEGRCSLFLGERVPAPPGIPGWINPHPWLARGEWHVFEPGSVIDIQPYQVHAIMADGDEPVRIFEVSTAHSDDDSYRIANERNYNE